MERFDFSGWATRNDLKCSDGRTIRKDAFKHNDGNLVPLVWNHSHDNPENVLGKVALENRSEGVYAYGIFNDTKNGRNAKELVEHGDVTALSIYANKLQQNGGDVIHGDIKEVSLVLAGANPGAYIDSVIAHGEESDEGAVIFTGECIEIYHSEEEEEPAEEVEMLEHSEEEKEVPEENKSNEKTVKDVFNTFNEEQKNVFYYMLGEILKKNKSAEEDNMKHNVFDNEEPTNVLSHSDMENIIKDAKRVGSLKEAFLAHAETNGVAGEDYGITDLDFMFPDAKFVENEPTFIKRDTEWVNVVMSAVSRSPFSRIKSLFADITEDEARAKGYIKGTLKKEEVFSLLKRSTTPTTIYKKQKLDRDDVIDITDFNVIAWIKKEMRLMLDEEVARAILIGDGRLASSDDKINEQNIRPVFNDSDLYTVKYKVNIGGSETDAELAKLVIDSVVRSRKQYKGSGNPTLFTTEDLLTEMLLLEDGIGHKLYKTEAELATAMRVRNIVTVEPMEGLKIGNDPVLAVMVNLKDYKVGADKGGEVNLFDDFDIDYNQMKYLMETRCSGALVKPYAAVTFLSHIVE